MMPTGVYEMGALKAGNVIVGPAIIEAPTTTMVVPQDARVEIDEYLNLRLRRDSSK
jgi:N-methylhydantoinase A